MIDPSTHQSWITFHTSIWDTLYVHSEDPRKDHRKRPRKVPRKQYCQEGHQKGPQRETQEGTQEGTQHTSPTLVLRGGQMSIYWVRSLKHIFIGVVWHAIGNGGSYFGQLEHIRYLSWAWTWIWPILGFPYIANSYILMTWILSWKYTK